MLKIIPLILLSIGALAELPTPSSGLSQYGRNLVLEYHNAVRRRIATEGHVKGGKLMAANMRKMNYDIGLEVAAMRYALTNPLVIGARQISEGYTLFHTSGRLNNSEIIEHDYAFRNYQSTLGFWTPQNLTREFFNFSRNWFQMIWATSSKVGCASKFYNEDGENRTIFVCKYDQPVVVGKEIYEVGLSCSHCPVRTSCEASSKLCSS